VKELRNSLVLRSDTGQYLNFNKDFHKPHVSSVYHLLVLELALGKLAGILCTTSGPTLNRPATQSRLQILFNLQTGSDILGIPPAPGQNHAPPAESLMEEADDESQEDFRERLTQ